MIIPAERTNTSLTTSTSEFGIDTVRGLYTTFIGEVLVCMNTSESFKMVLENLRTIYPMDQLNPERLRGGQTFERNIPKMQCTAFIGEF